MPCSRDSFYSLYAHLLDYDICEVSEVKVLFVFDYNICEVSEVRVLFVFDYNICEVSECNL